MIGTGGVFPRKHMPSKTASGNFCRRIGHVPRLSRALQTSYYPQFHRLDVAMICRTASARQQKSSAHRIGGKINHILIQSVYLGRQAAPVLDHPRRCSLLHRRFALLRLLCLESLENTSPCSVPGRVPWRFRCCWDLSHAANTSA